MLRMPRTPLAGLLLASAIASSALADDSIDRALADLASEDASRRDAALEAISDAGGAARERAEAALRNTEDPEVRARLEKVLPWLRIEATTAAFLQACGDQWFAMKEDDAITGVEHHTAALAGEGRDRRWTFVEEAWMRGDDGKTLYARSRTLMRHNAGLTPLEADVKLPGSHGFKRWFWRFEAGGDVKHYSLEYDSATVRTYWSRSKPDRKLTGPVLPSWNIERALERSTIAGNGPFEIRIFGRSHGVEEPLIRFDPGPLEEIQIEGHRMKARTWTIRDETDESAGSMLVSPEHGLIRAALRGSLVVEVSDEQTCRATGLVVGPELGPDLPPPEK